MLQTCESGEHSQTQDLDNIMTAKPPPTLCSFCGSTAAAVSVGKTKLCLLHYYTTLHGRSPMTVLDESMYAEQSPAVQELFASVYLDVRQELQDATARNAQDPLGILNQLSSTSKQHKKKAGGFLPKEPPAPARLLAVQQAQQKSHDALIQRMNAGGKQDITQRRKPTRQSIWNSVLSEPPSKTKDQTNDEVAMTSADIICSSCGSTNVESLHSSQRRHDMAKAETWSNKDREGDIMQQYRCGQCGKIWHEQE